MTAHSPPQRLDEPRPATLGDLLYSSGSPPPEDERDWARLVRGIAARDQRALRALYARTYRLVFAVIVRIVERPEIANDVALDVFHDVWRRASGYTEDDGPVLGWILNQARSRAAERRQYPAAAAPEPETLVRSHLPTLREALSGRSPDR